MRRYADFAEYLAEDPSRAWMDASELAARFGLDETEVAMAQARIAPKTGTRTLRLQAPAIFGRLSTWCSAHFRATTMFFAASNVTMAVLFSLLIWPTVILGKSHDYWWLDGAAGATVLLVLGLQWWVLFLHGSLRASVVSAALLLVTVVGGEWGCYALASIVSPVPGLFKPDPDWLSTDFAFFIAQLFIAWIISVVGAHHRLQKVEVEKRQRSRKEMLERLMEIRAQLDDPDIVTKAQLRVEKPHWAKLRSLWFLCIPGAGLLSMGVSTASFLPDDLGGFFMILVMAVIGFVGGSIGRGALFGLMMVVFITAVRAGFFLNGIGTSPAETVLVGIAMGAIVGGIGGLYAQVRRRYRREHLRDVGQPSELVAEMMLLRQELGMQQRDTNVVVIDVVASTLIKLDQDPELVEYSFRAYHELVERIAADHQGRVLGSAGDAALCEFGEPQLALSAARAFIAALDEFNAAENRLSKAFQVRIGIHLEQVSGSLEDVQFSRAIDVAAHLEKFAPVGGIAMSDSVAKRLNEPVRATGQETDGHRVFVLAPQVALAG